MQIGEPLLAGSALAVGLSVNGRILDVSAGYPYFFFYVYLFFCALFSSSFSHNHTN
jgi:hypothetical protein